MYSSWNGKGTMDNTCMEDQEMIHEFLIESYENLSRLDQDLVELEKHPKDALLLGSIFRTIHTIKGACGFLAFSILEGITHQAESILSQLRDGERELTPALVSLILETVDATRKVLASIEESGTEGSLLFDDLISCVPKRNRRSSMRMGLLSTSLSPSYRMAPPENHFLTSNPLRFTKRVNK
jgi:two-component system chemotaxis sensor kinase CheA